VVEEEKCRCMTHDLSCVAGLNAVERKTASLPQRKSCYLFALLLFLLFSCTYVWGSTLRGFIEVERGEGVFRWGSKNSEIPRCTHRDIYNPLLLDKLANTPCSVLFVFPGYGRAWKYYQLKNQKSKRGGVTQHHKPHEALVYSHFCVVIRP
jgi:hypothetical protein